MRIALLFVQLAEIERRLECPGLRLDLLLILLNRGLHLAPLLGDQREVEMREPHVRLLRDRGADLLLCFRSDRRV